MICGCCLRNTSPTSADCRFRFTLNRRRARGKGKVRPKADHRICLPASPYVSLARPKADIKTINCVTSSAEAAALQHTKQLARLQLDYSPIFLKRARPRRAPAFHVWKAGGSSQKVNPSRKQNRAFAERVLRLPLSTPQGHAFFAVCVWKPECAVQSQRLPREWHARQPMPD